jgi:hypothetical protein
MNEEIFIEEIKNVKRNSETSIQTNTTLFKQTEEKPIEEEEIITIPNETKTIKEEEKEEEDLDGIYVKNKKNKKKIIVHEKYKLL